jgi:1-acyl-sn-glycerol-3-phosphate acyltransferase
VSPRGTAWYFFVLWVARHIVLRFFSGGLKIIGQENIPLEGPVILAPNHVSFFDPPVVSCGSPRCVAFLAKEELFRPPVFGPLIRSLNAFPVKRGAGDTSAVRLALEKLGEGHCLIMFPEGTRGDGKTLGPMQSGVALMAKKSGALVVPVGVYGTHKILPKGRKLPGFSRLRVAYGRPFTYADASSSEDDKLNRRLFSERLEREIVEQCRTAGLELKTSPARESSPTPGSVGTAP